LSDKFHLILFNFFLLFPSQTYSWWMWTPGDHVDNSTQSMVTNGYHPDQPIPFSHRLHAGEKKISCNYCHSAAKHSTTAGIPPVSTCMGCHKIVAKDSPHIKYLTKKYNKKEPIKWTRVNALPDYVRFSHKVHIHAKGEGGKNLLSCESCHGNVKAQVTAEQWAPLQMGWCLECHNKVKIPAKNGKPVVHYAPRTCNTCHY
jgi:hypothetical protein